MHVSMYKLRDHCRVCLEDLTAKCLFHLYDEQTQSSNLLKATFFT